MTGVFLLAGVVKGVVGMGLPTVSMALLALVMPPAEAAALLVVPSLVTNVWQLRPWGSLGPLARRLAPMQVGVCVGTLVGAWCLGAPGGSWATAVLGLVLCVYAAWALYGSRAAIDARVERWLGPPVGVATGLLTAATGVFVVPAVPYLQSLELDRDALIRAMGLSFTVSTIVLALGLLANGRFPAADATRSLAMLAPALIGMYGGTRLRATLSPVVFRRWFLRSLIALGVFMIVRRG